MKFHEDILNSFQVTEQKPYCDGQTDDPGKNNMSPNPKRGRHNQTRSVGLQVQSLSDGPLFRLFRDHNSCHCALWQP